MFFLPVQGFAQQHYIDTLWTRTMGDNTINIIYCIEETYDGCYVSVGETGLATGPYRRDVYLVKTSPNGDTLWTSTFGGTDNDMGFYVQETSDSGLVISGYTASYGAGSYDVYILRTDSLGRLMWTSVYGFPSYDRGRCIQETRDGGYIVVGDAHSQYQMYMLKLDASGDTVWTRLLGRSNDTERGFCVRQLQDEGYIITGYATRGGQSNGLFIMRTDASGDTLWMRYYSGNVSSEGRWIEPTGDGNYIAVGTFRLNSLDNSQVYLLKINSNGNLLWSKKYALEDFNYGYCVKPTPDGGYIICGGTSSDWGDIDRALIIRTDGNGNKLWTRTLEPGRENNAYCLDLTSDGNYVIGGYSYFSGSIEDFMWAKLSEPQTIAPITTSQFPLRLSPNGGRFSFNLAIANNSVNPLSVDLCLSVTHQTTGFSYPLYTRSRVPLPIGGYYNRRDIWLNVPGAAPAGYYYLNCSLCESGTWRLAGEDCIKFEKRAFADSESTSPGGWGIIGMEDFPVADTLPKFLVPSSQFSVFNSSPNPFNPETALSYQLQAASNVELAIYDIAGREVAVLAEGFYPTGTHQAVWDASSMASGVYFARLQVGDEVATTKLLLVK